VPPTKLLAALAATSLLVACGDDDSSDDADVDTDSTTIERGNDDDGGGAAAGDIAVEGEFAESAGITIPEGFEVTELVTEDLIEGDGPEAAPGATVTVHYHGVLLDGTTFDASYGAAPATFPLDQVIAGWTEGIPGMKVGGRRLLVIPSELAYGAQGAGSVIPPNADLVFVVDLLEVA
jgi:FKBP-type peptidyl-prolyl cis-trans isomerase